MHLSKYAWYNFHRSQTGFDDIYVTARNSRKSQLHMYTYKGCEIKRAFGRFACHVILYTILGTTSYTLSLLTSLQFSSIAVRHVASLDFTWIWISDWISVWISLENLLFFYSEDTAYEQWTHYSQPKQMPTEYNVTHAAARTACIYMHSWHSITSPQKWPLYSQRKIGRVQRLFVVRSRRLDFQISNWISGFQLDFCRQCTRFLNP